MDLRTAINEVLISINELPLDETDNIEDVNSAILIKEELLRAKREVLLEGWNFNTLLLNLSPNSNGYIILPESFLFVYSKKNKNITMRDWKLFDKAKQSFIFDKPEECVIIQDVSFDDIPYPVMNYIIKKAILKSYITIIGSSDELKYKYADIKNAKKEAMKYEARTIRGNLYEDEYIVSLSSRGY